MSVLQFQHAKGQVVGLLMITVEPSVSQEVRQSAAIAFKNLVKESWSPSGAGCARKLGLGWDNLGVGRKRLGLGCWGCTMGCRVVQTVTSRGGGGMCTNAGLSRVI